MLHGCLRNSTPSLCTYDGDDIGSGGDNGGCGGERFDGGGGTGERTYHGGVRHLYHFRTKQVQATPA